MDVKFVITCFLAFCLCHTVFGVENKARFIAETVADQIDVVRFKKVATSLSFGLLGENSMVQCAIVCFNEDTCVSVHMDGGACVFGVTANVTAFDEDGEDTTPTQDQIVKAKSMFILLKYFNSFCPMIALRSIIRCYIR